jgi:hypothetical protein
MLRAQKLQCSPGPNSRGRAGATRVASRRLSYRASSANPHRQREGIIWLSDPGGHFEAVIFPRSSPNIATARPGNAVLLFLSAEVQGD